MTKTKMTTKVGHLLALHAVRVVIEWLGMLLEPSSAKMIKLRFLFKPIQPEYHCQRVAQ